MGSLLHRFTLPASLIAAAERVSILNGPASARGIKCACGGDAQEHCDNVFVSDPAEIPLAPVRTCSLECLAYELIYAHGDDQRDTPEDVAVVRALVESSLAIEEAARCAPITCVCCKQLYFKNALHMQAQLGTLKLLPGVA